MCLKGKGGRDKEKEGEKEIRGDKERRGKVKSNISQLMD
jgi:hypothetical protein